jgi:hypothetical protein
VIGLLVWPSQGEKAREKCSTHGEKRNEILLQNMKARDVDRGNAEINFKN